MKEPIKLKTHKRLKKLPNQFWDKSFWENEYINNEKSLPLIKKEYGIAYADTLYFLDWFNIPKRTIKNAQTERTKRQREETNLNKFGHRNCLGKNTTAYHKKNNTVKEKYGVDNIFQLKSIIEKINTEERNLKKRIRAVEKWENFTEKEKKDFLLNTIHKFKTFDQEEYKLYCEKISLRNKNIWDSKTEKQKIERLNNSILREDVLINKKNFKSSLEIIFEVFLNEFNFNFIPQYAVKYRDNYFYYDIFLTDYNLIIELNGDYWHCNPLYYKENDIITFPKGVKKVVKDVWKKDKLKQNHIKKKHNLLVIWETEFNENKNNLFEFFKNKINEILKNLEDRAD